MVSSISNVTNTQPVAQPTDKSTQKTTQSQPKATTGGDSVKLSQAAQAQLAALQEAMESSTQTAAEAGRGDVQAQRLLAKETAR